MLKTQRPPVAYSDKYSEGYGKNCPDEIVQIVVPVYNEGEQVIELYKQLNVDGVQFHSLRFVYDFAEDTSLPYIKQLAADDSRVEALRNTYGRGVLNALRFAFSCVEAGPVIVVMGDRSDKLSIIPEMIDLWERGATVVSPSRYTEGGKQHGGGVMKSGLSRIAGKSLRYLGFPTSDPTNNFKLYDGRWLIEQQIESNGGFEIALELCYKAHQSNRTIAELPTEWFDRTEGQSKFHLFKWLPHYLRWYFKILKLQLT